MIEKKAYGLVVNKGIPRRRLKWSLAIQNFTKKEKKNKEKNNSNTPLPQPEIE